MFCCERAPRRAGGLFRNHTALQLVLLLHLQMAAHFVFQLALERGAALENRMGAFALWERWLIQQVMTWGANG